MSQPNDLSRCLVPLEQDTTLVAVIELSQSSWLIAGTVPGIERQPLKKILPDEAALLRLLHRWLLFQQDSALAKWFRSRTEGANGARKTKMIVALARKLLIALWRMVTTGEVPHGVVLRPAA